MGKLRESQALEKSNFQKISLAFFGNGVGGFSSLEKRDLRGWIADILKSNIRVSISENRKPTF
jgi:hypothetical protein